MLCEHREETLILPGKQGRLLEEGPGELEDGHIRGWALRLPGEGVQQGSASWSWAAKQLCVTRGGQAQGHSMEATSEERAYGLRALGSREWLLGRVRFVIYKHHHGNITGANSAAPV